MENLFKKNLRFAIIGLSVILIVSAFSIYRAVKEIERGAEMSKHAGDFLNPNTEAGKKAIKIHEEYEHIDKGKKYQTEGKYDLAIEEYKKAEELAEGGYKGISKRYLAEVYEKTGQYDLALKEIEWLISRGPREEVIKELNAWKSRIQKLKEAKASEGK